MCDWKTKLLVGNDIEQSKLPFLNHLAIYNRLRPLQPGCLQQVIFKRLRDGADLILVRVSLHDCCQHIGSSVEASIS